MRRPVWLALAVALLACGLSSGCVTRRVMITSDPPGAIVYRDGQPLGPTPVEHPFVYYGKYRYRLIKDGYAPLDVEPEIVPPFYEYPGLDLIAENVLPFTLRDTQRLHFQLVPLEAVRTDDVRAAAETLRGRASQIPGTPRARRSGKETPNESVKGTPNETLPADFPFVGIAPPADKPDAASSDGPAAANASAKKPEKKKEPVGNVGFQSVPPVRLEQVVTPSPDAPSR
jgi:hypothetical protein